MHRKKSCSNSSSWTLWRENNTTGSTDVALKHFPVQIPRSPCENLPKALSVVEVDNDDGWYLVFRGMTHHHIFQAYVLVWNLILGSSVRVFVHAASYSITRSRPLKNPLSLGISCRRSRSISRASRVLTGSRWQRGRSLLSMPLLPFGPMPKHWASFLGSRIESKLLLRHFFQRWAYWEIRGKWNNNFFRCDESKPSSQRWCSMLPC